MKPPELSIEYKWQAEKFVKSFDAHPKLSFGYWKRGMSKVSNGAAEFSREQLAQSGLCSGDFVQRQSLILLSDSWIP